MNGELIREIVSVAAFLLSLFLAWYKINSDLKEAIQSVKKESDDKLGKLRGDVEIIRATSVTRVEHERDIERVGAEIKVFRDEVREDIRGLNSTITSRFDMMMSRLFDYKPNTNGSKS
jgi:hypothetical protein